MGFLKVDGRDHREHQGFTVQIRSTKQFTLYCHSYSERRRTESIVNFTNLRDFYLQLRLFLNTAIVISLFFYRYYFDSHVSALFYSISLY